MNATKAQARLVQNARGVLQKIKHLFTEVEYWNTHCRQKHETPINPDPDGSIAALKEEMEKLIGKGGPHE